MAEPTGAGTKAIVDAIQQSSQGTINGVTAATKEVQKEVGDLTNKITSQLGDLSDTVEDNKPSEEDKKESKNTQNKQLGVLGAIAGSLLALPKVLATTTMDAASKGKGLFGAVLGSELVENAVSLGKTVLEPVAAVAGAAAKVAAPILKQAGKFGLIAGGVFAAIEGVKGAFEGVSRAGEIFGVEQDQATVSQKISAGIGGFVEGIANAPATLLEMIGMGELAKKWRTFIDQFDITERIALSIEPTIAKITKFFEPLGPIFEKLGNFVKTKIVPHVMPVLEQIFDFFSNIVGGVFEKIREVGIFQKIETLILTISDVVGGVFKSVIDSGILPKLKTFFEEVFVGFYNTFVDRIGLVLDKLNEAFVAAKPAIDKVVQILTGIVEFLMPIVKTITTGVLFPAITKAFGLVMDVLTFVGQGLMMVINPIVDFIAKFFPEGGSGPEDLGNKFANGIQLVFDTIFGFIDNVTDWMKTNLTWENIIQGVKDFSVFIVDKFSEIWSDATHKLGDAIESVKKSLVLFIRKIPLLSEFGMTDEEKLVKQQTDNINKLAKDTLLDKQDEDLAKVKKTFESTDPRMINALIQGGQLNVEALQVLRQVMREAKEAGTAANQMNNITTIDNSNNVNAPTTNNQGGVIISDGNLSASTNE
jgi:hypothetical protein